METTLTITTVTNLPARAAINFLWAGQPEGVDGWVDAQKRTVERTYVRALDAVRAAEAMCAELRAAGAQFIISMRSAAGTTFTWTHLDHYVVDADLNTITDERSIRAIMADVSAERPLEVAA